MIVCCLSCGKTSTPAPPAPIPAPGPTPAPVFTSCKLPNTSNRRDIGLGFPRGASRQKASGTVKTAVIFVDFSDAVASRTPQEVFGIMSPASENFISSVSFGSLNVVFEPKFKWYRMSKPSTGYGWNQLTFDLHKSYIQEAVDLADPEYDFSQTDQIVIMSNPYAGALTNGPMLSGSLTNGIFADGNTIANAVTSGRDLLVYTGLWFPHEFGHCLGLPDLYGYSGQQHRFVGDFSLMGNILGTAPDFNAWEKWLLGWFTDNQVSCVNARGTGSVQLTPSELKDGMKLLILRIKETTALIVEDRRAIGYDSRIVKPGPVVYLIDTRIAGGSGVLKILPADENDLVKANAPLGVGESVTYGNVTVKCVASGAGGSTIEYELR